jgi:hypothetical protein
MRHPNSNLSFIQFSPKNQVNFKNPEIFSDHIKFKDEVIIPIKDNLVQKEESAMYIHQ